MAQDIANIWSKDIKGLGFIGAAPYYNEAANDLKALYVTDKTPKQMADKSEEMLQQKFKANLVQDPKNIKQQRVYQMKQQLDDVCIPPRQEAAEIFYKDIHGVNFKQESLPIGHKLPRILFPDAEIPQFDAAGNMLTHVLGRTLKPLSMDWGGLGKLIDFP